MALTLSITLVLYIASAGPAAWSVVAGHVNIDTHGFVYAPIDTVEARSDLAYGAMKWWRGLFLDDEEEYWWGHIQAGNVILNEDGGIQFIFDP